MRRSINCWEELPGRRCWCTAMPAVKISKKQSKPPPITSNLDIKRFARRAAYLDCKAHTELAAAKCTMSQRKKMHRSKTLGVQSCTSTLYRGYSNGCAKNSGRIFICC